MGSDMSRPKNKCKNNYSSNCYNDTRSKPRPYSKSMVFRDPDFDMPPNMILHERGSSPMQARSSTMNRKSFENSSYIDNRSSRDARSLNESPIASNASTPHLTPRLPVYYTDDKPSKHHRIPVATGSVSSSASAPIDRYKTTRIITRSRDYEREPHYSNSSRYQPAPGMYETFESSSSSRHHNSSKHDTIELVPVEGTPPPPSRGGIYTHKETKYILKPLERSQSPLPSRSIRSRSSDRVLDSNGSVTQTLPKTVRYEDDFYINKSSSEDSDAAAAAAAQQKHKHSYFVNNSQSHRSNENSVDNNNYHHQRYRDNIYVEKRVQQQQHKSEYDIHNQIESKSSSAIVNVCTGSEIVYVPMVKEEFIKRETQKTNNQAQLNSNTTHKTTIPLPQQQQQLPPLPPPQSSHLASSSSSSSSSLNKALPKNTNYANPAYDANLPSKNTNNHINEILKVQRQPNKIIITELVAPNNNHTHQHQQRGAGGGEGFQKRNSFDSSSNETLAQNNAYPHFDPHITRKQQQQQHNNKHFQSAQAQATFQPAPKTPSFRRAEQADCNTLCEKSSSSNSIQTHYIIQPDPNFDTKIIDGLLKQKKLSDFEENKF